MFGVNRWLYSLRQSHIAINLILAIGVGSLLGVGAFVFPSITILALVAILLIYAVVPRPIISCYLLVFVITVASGMERGRLIPMLAPNELMLFATAGISILYVMVHGRGKSFPTTIMVAATVLIVGTAIIPIASYRLRGFYMDFATMFKFLAPIQYIMLFWLYNTIPKTDEERMRILQVMFASSSVVSIIGLLQATNLQAITDFLVVWYPSDHTFVAAEVGRITSLLGSWNTLGTYMMFILLLLVSLQNDIKSRAYKINMGLAASLALLTLIASGSYASLGGLVVGFIALKFFDPRGLRKLMPFFFVAGIGVLILAPIIGQRLLYQFDNPGGGLVPQTLAYRFKVWEQIYIPIILQEPLWGVTPTLANLGWAFAESHFLLLLVTTGLVGLTAFLTWWGGVVLWLVETIRKAQPHTINRSISFTVMLMMIILLIMSLTNEVFTFSGVVDYIWILLGVAASSQKEKLHITY